MHSKQEENQAINIHNLKTFKQITNPNIVFNQAMKISSKKDWAEEPQVMITGMFSCLLEFFLKKKNTEPHLTRVAGSWA